MAMELQDMMGWYGASTGWWFVMTLTMVIFWGAIVAIVVGVLRAPVRRGGDHQMRADAVLEERLARGDITPEEFDVRRQAMLRGRS